jgi:RNA polymerase sigma-70 factor (ECF subfamily)
MERICGRDPGALEEFYDRHASLVYAICLRVLRDAREAEEVLQEVFLEVWRRVERYDAGRASPRVYLVQVSRSRALDRLRRNRRRSDLGRRALAEADAGIDDAVCAEPLPIDGAIAAQEGRRIRIALRALPESQRRALMLAFFDGLSHSEIAEALGEPLGTVKTRIRKGLLRMREVFVSLFAEEDR